MQERRVPVILALPVIAGILLIGVALALILRTPRPPAVVADVTATPSATPQPTVQVAAQPSDTPAEGASPESVTPTGAGTPGEAAPAGTAQPTAYVPVEVGDAYDGHDTVLVSEIVPGRSITDKVEKAFDAHNYRFVGKAGQVVTIRVDGVGSTDPRVALFSSNGTLLVENDDSAGGVNARVEATLPADDTYTIRVTVWSVGEYTLTLEVR